MEKKLKKNLKKGGFLEKSKLKKWGWLLLALLFSPLLFMRKESEISSVSSPDLYSDFEKLMIDWEGMRYKAYIDIAGHATIGIGHKILPGEPHLKTAVLTPGEVREIFKRDFNEASKVFRWVTASISHNQKLAILSMSFNLGSARVGQSTLVKRINQGDKNASEEFLKWVYFTNPKTGQKEVSPGLMNRRKKEKALFDKQ